MSAHQRNEVPLTMLSPTQRALNCQQKITEQQKQQSKAAVALHIQTHTHTRTAQMMHLIDPKAITFQRDVYIYTTVFLIHAPLGCRKTPERCNVASTVSYYTLSASDGGRGSA